MKHLAYVICISAWIKTTRALYCTGNHGRSSTGSQPTKSHRISTVTFLEASILGQHPSPFSTGVNLGPLGS